MKRNPTLLLTLIVIAVMFFTQQCTDQKTSFRDTLLQVSKEANKQFPKMIDELTRLDSTSVVSDNTLQYNYTLVGNDKEAFDTSKITSILIPDETNKIKMNKDLNLLKENKVIFKHVYIDKNGAYAFSYSITPEMYKK